MTSFSIEMIEKKLKLLAKAAEDNDSTMQSAYASVSHNEMA